MRRHHQLPIRLLGIGLPLTIVAGLALAVFFLPNLSLIEATLLAIVLAPTDAALGQAVVVNPAVPERIHRALNVESGLNDGLVFPLLVIVASLALAESAPTSSVSLLGWGSLVFTQLTFGPMAIPTAAYASAELIGGNGFLATFVCGLTVGAISQPLRVGI